MLNIKFQTTEYVNSKLKHLKGRTKVRFQQNVINFFDEMESKWQSGSFQYEEDTLDENVQDKSKSFHEVLLLVILLQTGPQVNSMNKF